MAVYIAANLNCGMMMADTDEPVAQAPKKALKLPLLLGLLLFLVGAGGGFFTISSGLIPGGSNKGNLTGMSHQEESLPIAKGGAEVAFLPVEPLIISLNGGQVSHLRFRAQLEVEKSAVPEVEHLLPRVVDVLNGYLRAVELTDLQDNASLVRLRAQMLRRVQVVAGGSRVRDLLIMEFVLN